MFEKFDPQIISAAISVVGTIITALIGQAILSRKRLQEKLEIAQADIAYLLLVEHLHCEKHRELSRASFKLRIRKEANEQGLTWSGRFTPGRVRTSRGAGRTLSTTIGARIIVLARLSVRATAHASAWCIRRLRVYLQRVGASTKQAIARHAAKGVRRRAAAASSL